MLSPSRPGCLLHCQATRLTFDQRHAWRSYTSGLVGTTAQLHNCSLLVGVTPIDKVSISSPPKPQTKKKNLKIRMAQRQLGSNGNRQLGILST